MGTVSISAVAAASSELALLNRAQGLAVSVLKSAADQQVALLEVVAEQAAAGVQASAGDRGQQLDMLV